MDITQILIYLVIGTAFGSGAIYVLFYLIRQQIINEAKEEAQELLKEAGDQANAEEQERKERIQEIELEAWADVEDLHLTMEQKIDRLGPAPSRDGQTMACLGVEPQCRTQPGGLDAPSDEIRCAPYVFRSFGLAFGRQSLEMSTRSIH